MMETASPTPAPAAAPIATSKTSPVTTAVRATIAIVGVHEDDWRAARRLLEARGHACRWLPAGNGRDEAFAGYDLIVAHADHDLSATLALTARVKAFGPIAPAVLLVAASAEEADIELALTRGADDYLTWPVSAPLLAARVDAAVRVRQRTGATEAPRQIGPYGVDMARRIVTLHGRPVRLTAREFDVAALLLVNVGRRLSRAYVLETLWGYRSDVPTRTVDTHVSRVRNKLGMVAENGAHLTSHYGFGYQLDLSAA